MERETKTGCNTSQTADRESSLWQTKVVVLFEYELTPSQVHDWINAYNEDGLLKLMFHDELMNAMYVLMIDAKTWQLLIRSN
jgi:hypothetical protein